MRRAFFSSTIRRRRTSRTFSYSTRLRISEVSRSFTRSRLEPVGPREPPDGVLRLLAGPLLYLQRRQRAIGRRGRRAAGDRVEERLGHLERPLVVVLRQATPLGPR